MNDNATVLSVQDTAKKAIRHAKALINSAILPKSGSFIMFKKEFETAYKSLEQKKVLTQKDINNFLNIFTVFQESDNSTALNVAYELLRRGLELWHKDEYNPINNALYEKLADDDTPEDMKETIKNVINKKHTTKELGKLIAETYLSLENENVKSAFEDNTIKELFYKKIEEKIRNVKSLQKQRTMKETLEKNRAFIDGLFFDNYESYGKYVSKYVNLRNLYYEEDILTAMLSSELFKNSENRELYQGKSNNLREFIQTYFDTEKIPDELLKDDKKFYEELFAVKNQVESISNEEVERLNETINAIEAINSDKSYIYTKDGEKKLALKAIKENLNLPEDMFKLKTAVKEKIKAENIEIEDLSPHEIEALKQSALDKYYQRTLIGLYGLDNINPVAKFFGKVTGTKTDFFNEDGTINQERYVLNALINQPKAKLLKCLANAMNPKHTYETGAGLSSQCVKEYIQEIEKTLQNLDRIMNEGGQREVLGFTGLIFVVHLLRLHFYNQKKVGESNAVVLEKNYYEIKEMIMKLKNPLEIKQAEKYLELISKENRSKILIGDTRKELNAIVSLAIKDLTNYYVNYKNIKEFLELKKTMLLNKITRYQSLPSLYTKDVLLKKLSLNKENKEEYEKIKAKLLEKMNNDEFVLRVYEKLIEKGITKIDEENTLQTINEVLDETNSQVFKEKLFTMLDLSEEYIRLSELLENKKAIEKRMEVTEEEKNKLLEQLQKAEEENDLDSILLLKEKLADVIEEQATLKNFFAKTQIEIFKAQYGEKANNWVEIRDIEKSLEQDEKVVKELMKNLKRSKEPNYEETYNKVKEIEKSMQRRREMLEELANKPSEMEKKIKKIQDFVEQGRLILNQEDLNKYVDFINKEIMQNIENHIGEIKDAREKNLPELEKILKDIMKEKVAIELLFEQEQNLKKLTIEMLEKGNIDLSQYYGTLYNQTLDVIENSRERIKKLKDYIDKHLVEVSGDRVMLEFERVVKEKNEEGKEEERVKKIMFEMPRSEYRYLEKMNDLLKSGNYFELINTPDKKDVETLLKFLKNDYRRLTLYGQDIRKDLNIKVDWKIKEATNHTNIELEIGKDASLLEKFQGKYRYETLDKITDLTIKAENTLKEKTKEAFTHIKNFFTEDEEIEAVMYNVDKWEKEQREKEELREYLKELEGEQIGRKTRLHKHR